jgi:hypothetical protein
MTNGLLGERVVNDRGKMIALVAVVAVVVAGVMGFISGAAGARGTGTLVTNAAIGGSFAICALAIYIGLRNNRNVARASDGERQAALAGPKAGMAQLLVYRDGFVGKLAGVDVVLDNAVVAQLKSPRFAALDVAPGAQRFTASAQGKTTDPIMLSLAEGEVAVIHVSMVLGGVRAEREDDVAAVRAKLAAVPMVRPDGAAPPKPAVISMGTS